MKLTKIKKVLLTLAFGMGVSMGSTAIAGGYTECQALSGACQSGNYTACGFCQRQCPNTRCW